MHTDGKGGLNTDDPEEAYVILKNKLIEINSRH